MTARHDGPAVVVRAREPGDLPALADILVRVHGTDGYPVEGVAEPLAWLRPRGVLASWVALADDVPVGQVLLLRAVPGADAVRVWVRRTGGEPAGLAVMARLFVDPDHRRAGVGGALLAGLHAHADALGLTVALDVIHKDVAAIRLYERLGYRKLADVTHEHGGGHQDAAAVYARPATGR